MIVEITIICVSVLAGMGMWLFNRNGKWSEVHKQIAEQNKHLETYIKSVSDLENALINQKSRLDELIQKENKRALKGGFS